MHHNNKRLESSFDTPEKLTVRQQLEFMSVMHSRENEGDKYAAQWRAALPLISNWKCESIPDPDKFDMDSPANPIQMATVMWTGAEVFNLIMGLETVPKGLSSNSSSAPSGESLHPQS